jgi:hypothetical protein
VRGTPATSGDKRRAWVKVGAIFYATLLLPSTLLLFTYLLDKTNYEHHKRLVMWDKLKKQEAAKKQEK